MSTKIGRNDPCHCGSGKKYKRCHLPLDQKREPVVDKPLEADAEIPPPAPLARFSAKNTASLLREFASKTSKKERAGLDDILAQVLEYAEYMEKEEEIEAAARAMEPYREEFDRFQADEKASINHARTLFGEERFAPLWFTAEDIRSAFKSIGGVPNFSVPDEASKSMLAAILSVATKERRTRWAMSLAKNIPDYVKAGRFMDAWLIQLCGHATSEYVEQSNPFLYEMFAHGYEAWTCEAQARGLEFMRDNGLDPARVQSMSLDEIEAFVQEQEADPAKQRRIEAFMKAHPDYRDMAIANTRRLEHEFGALLQRQDARSLFLSKEEIGPWLPELMDAWVEAVEGVQMDANNPANEQTAKLADNVIFPMLSEMAQAIFTPERIQQLAVQFGKYQRDLFAAGDKAAAACVMPALASWKEETEPGRNYFLVALCFASMGVLIEQMAKQDPAQTDL